MNRKVRITWRAAIVLLLLGTLTLVPAAGRAHATPARSSQWVIALSNSFLGNTWRKTMVGVFTRTAQQAKA